MANISPEELDGAIRQQLTLYSQKVNENCYAAGLTAVKALVAKTKPTAPVKRGDFRKAISFKELFRNVRGFLFAWYVKNPHYRRTHLLVHGHAKQNGGRVPGDPFLENALAEVLPQFEKNIEEAVKHDP